MMVFVGAIALLLAGSGAAEAGPVAAAIGAIGAWAGSAVAALSANAFGAFLLRTAISFGMSALARALNRPQSAPMPGLRTSQATAGETTPASLILGNYATAGNHVCPPMTHGAYGGGKKRVNNAYMFYCLDLGDAPIGGVTGVWVDDRHVDLTALTPDADGFWNLPEPFDGKVKIKYRDGSDTEADPFVMARVGGADQPRPWQADMIGRGIPHVFAEFKYDRELFKGLPRLLFEVVGIPLYDPRRDASVGGSGDQLWSDPSTWASSSNPVVQVYNIMRGLRLPDGGRWGGHAAVEDLPLSNWVAAMNECDKLVDGQPQYRAGYEVRIGPEALGGDEPASVIEELLRACAGALTEIGGVWKIRVGGPGLPVATLTDDDIIVTDRQDFAPFPALTETFNGIHAQYPEPAEKWASKEAPARYNAEYEASDQGRRLVASLQLPACPYGDQVQRVMRAYIEEERRFRRHSITLPPDYAALEPLDAVAWTSPENGYSGKIFEVTGTTVDPVTLCVRVDLRERDPADYGWQSDYKLPVTINPVTTPLPIAEAVPEFAAVGVVVEDDQGRARRAACQMTWDSDQPDVRGVRYEIRAVGRSDLAAQGSTQDVTAGGLRVTDGILPGAAMEARARLVVDRPTRWTDWLPFAAPAVGLIWDDLASEVKNDVTDLTEWMDDARDNILPAIRADLAEQVAAVEAQAAALDAEAAQRISDGFDAASRWRATVREIADLRDYAADLSYQADTERHELRRSLTADLGAYAASFDERITTAVSATGAIAERVTRLDAASTDLRADLIRIETAQVDADAALAQQINGLSVGTTSQFDPAVIWHFDTTTEGWSGSWVNGWLRPGASSASPAIAVDGSAYRQVRMRLRRVGSVTWTGGLSWAGGSLTIPEPEWVGDVANITVDPDWSGEIAGIALSLASAGTVEIDWIAIGRPAPGASSADLIEERRARIDGDEAQARRSDALQADLDVANNTLSGQAQALDGLETRVTNHDGTLTSHGEAITSLNNRVSDPSTGLTATAEAVGRLEADVQAIEGGSVTSQGRAITALRNSLLPLASEVVDQDFAQMLADMRGRAVTAEAAQYLDTQIKMTADQIESVSSAVTKIAASLPGLATASALSGLTTRVTASEGRIESLSQSITSLTATLDQKASASAVNSLSTRVTQAEDRIDSVASDLTSLTSEVEDKASASAVSDLSTRVTDAEGRITAQGQSVTSLTSALQNTDAAVAAASALAGSKGKVLVQSSSPSAADRQPQNLWIDTTGGKNTPKRWSGSSWQAVTDKVALDAAAAAADALAQVAIKASASAVNSLTTRVSDAEGAITAQADQITSVTAKADRVSAGGLLRISAEATPAGAQSRVGLRAEASSGDTSQWAALFLEANSDGKSSAGVVADRFYVATGPQGQRTAPFVVQNGRVYIDTLLVRDASIDGAKIKELTVDTIHLKDGAVSTQISGSIAAVQAAVNNHEIGRMNIRSEKGEYIILGLDWIKYYPHTNRQPSRVKITWNGEEIAFGQAGSSSGRNLVNDPYEVYVWEADDRIITKPGAGVKYDRVNLLLATSGDNILIAEGSNIGDFLVRVTAWVIKK